MNTKGEDGVFLIDGVKKLDTHFELMGDSGSGYFGGELDANS